VAIGEKLESSGKKKKDKTSLKEVKISDDKHKEDNEEPSAPSIHKRRRVTRRKRR
jgi:hypothetical protein